MTARLHPIGTDPVAPSSRRADADWLLMALAFAATGMSQLVGQMILGRVLGPVDYGQVATLVNVMSFAGVPLVAVQLTVTGFVARGGSVATTLVRYAKAGAAIGAVAVLTAPLWGGALAVSSATACRVTALFLPATFLVAVTRGNAVGRRRTRPLAGAMTVAAVVRVGASIAGAEWFGIAGAVGAVVASELILGLALLALVRPSGSATGPIVTREAAGATYSQVAMWLVVNVDLLWARRLLSGSDAGRYLVVGGVSMGLVSLGQAFLWHHASESTDPGVGRTIVRRSALIVAGASLVGVPAAAVALPELLGPGYGDLTPLLVVGGVWAVLASVVITGTATQLIAGRRGLQRLVPVAVIAAAGPPIWVAVIGDRPIALSIAATVNAALGAVVVMARPGVTS